VARRCAGARIGPCLSSQTHNNTHKLTTNVRGTKSSYEIKLRASINIQVTIVIFAVNLSLWHFRSDSHHVTAPDKLWPIIIIIDLTN